MAKRWGDLSKATRMKVGCLVVRDNQIISDGFNGTPSGFDNECETLINNEFITKPEVLHAESNALMKLACGTQSSKDATLYVTLSPCFDCSKLIIQAKIKRVVYSTEYRITKGIELLKKAGIIVDYINELS